MIAGLQEAAPAAPGIFDAIVLGIVEGITEFLPVSSTGHLIVTQRLLGLGGDAANNLFIVGIQIGAITAILVLYWRRLLEAARTVLRPVPGQRNLLWQIAIASLPAIVFGLLLDDWIEQNLFSPQVVATTIIIGGVLLLLLERMIKHRRGRDDLSSMSYVTAFGIGLFQCLALVPGTSRSGAMIAGAMILGRSRASAAEFSFLVGLPILYGAAGYKLLTVGHVMNGETVLPFVIATLVSFFGALLVVKPFVQFLRQHTLALFAWYRILAGAVLAWLCWTGFID